jgi:GntR family transcriptional regulator, rspAB operon transcriptional repressor
MPIRSPSLVEIDPTPELASVLPDRLCRILKRRILTCALLPGQRLRERDLCDELRISRTPLREALNRLVFEGLVVPMPYRGYAVAPLSLAGVREIAEIRRINEPEAAALAAPRITPAQVARLGQVATASYTPGNRAAALGYLRKNAAFHLEIVRATGNGRLQAIVMAALDQFQRPDYLGLELGSDSAENVGQEHLRIVEALRARDPDRARVLMAEHVAHAGERVIAALQASAFWKETTELGRPGSWSELNLA